MNCSRSKAEKNFIHHCITGRVEELSNKKTWNYHRRNIFKELKQKVPVCSRSKAEKNIIHHYITGRVVELSNKKHGIITDETYLRNKIKRFLLFILATEEQDRREIHTSRKDMILCLRFCMLPH